MTTITTEEINQHMNLNSDLERFNLFRPYTVTTTL
jgi:hypothetical protein